MVAVRHPELAPCARAVAPRQDDVPSGPSTSRLAAPLVALAPNHRGDPRGRSPAEEMTDVGPESAIAGLDETELAVLRQVAEHWGRALSGRRAGVRELPVDPALHRFPRSLEVRQASRFATVAFVETDDPAELVATAHASAGPSRSGTPLRCGVAWCWAHR